jgi:uncharacterized protein DUF3455
MKDCNASETQTMYRILILGCAAAFAATFMVTLPQPARADDVTVPPVHSIIDVPAGNKLFLVGHGRGTQNYICLPSTSGFAFSLFTPQATLFDDNGEQVITHYFSPNLSPIPPEIRNTIRATWQHSDTSTVWAKAIASYSNAGFVARGDIPLLLLQVVGAQDGPTGGNTLSQTTFIQRLKTSGGAAPSTGCSESKDVGHEAFVPYEADYFFYKAD